ncbi:MAG: 3-hydroxyacyl-ACP dehydratase FabZ [Coprothermobacterota bacterium]|nr:3-hydroxyacyl-ACP dehydratase FabZ [Coprothermobacterota bacterium]
MALNVVEIMKILPHRPPFLFVDRIVEIEPGKYAQGIKNVTINESFLNGHFPGHPIVPGVILLEAMAQVAAIALLSAEGSQGKEVLLGGVEKARFHRPVYPGDQLVITSRLTHNHESAGICQSTIHVQGELVASAQLLAVIK